MPSREASRGRGALARVVDQFERILDRQRASGSVAWGDLGSAGSFRKGKAGAPYREDGEEWTGAFVTGRERPARWDGAQSGKRVSGDAESGPSRGCARGRPRRCWPAFPLKLIHYPKVIVGGEEV